MKSLLLAVAAIGLFVSTSFAQTSPATKTDVINATQTITTNASANKDAITANDNANRDAIIQNSNQNKDAILAAIEAVRLIVVPPTPPIYCGAPVGTRFVAHANGTQMCDAELQGLLWDRVWNMPSSDINVKTKIYSDANQYCTSQGKRLPTIHELLSLTRVAVATPINTQYHAHLFVGLDAAGFSTGGVQAPYNGVNTYSGLIWSGTPVALENGAEGYVGVYDWSTGGYTNGQSTSTLQKYAYVCVQ